MIGAMAGGAAGAVVFRYRCEYLHVPTSSRILFTVGVRYEIEAELRPWDAKTVPADDLFPLLGSAGEAMAKRLAAKWIEQTGLAAECVMLGVVAVTDNMSVRIPAPTTRCVSCGYPVADGETLCGECACEDDGA